VSEELAREARAIFADALAAVDIRAAVQRELRREGGLIRELPLDELDQVLVVALGKAARPMAEAAHQALHGLKYRGVVVGPEPPLGLGEGWVLVQGAHPIPNARSLHAAQSVLALLATATPRTLVLFLISGGASAMVEQPLDPGLSLEDLAAFHRALVASGLAIGEMNAMRKHLSAVKGGRLAQAAAKARAQLTLLVSDVPALQPDAIGSGPSLPDSTTLQDCAVPLRQTGAAFPSRVREFFAGPLCVETPKPAHPAFARASWTVLLSSAQLAEAAAQAARARGFLVEVDNTCDEWEYRDAARFLLERSAALAGDQARNQPRTCLISVGEVSVALPPNPGTGGRNQQLALWCAGELARRREQATVLSAGSDGADGNSAAAGAVCDETTVARADQLSLSTTRALAAFESAPLLSAIGDQIVTGPTGNNLRDLRLVLRG
jgi:hydroxypyruvate reductase